MQRKHVSMFVACLAMIGACLPVNNSQSHSSSVIKPVIVTEPTPHDTDDPAIWVHPSDPAQSLVIGTDKEQDGGLYVFDLNGKILNDKVVRNLQRPNNVDVEYGLRLNDSTVDIAVVTERLTNKLRVFRLPDMKALDQGGFAVFEGEEERAPMGVALFRKPASGEIFVFVSRKHGPQDGYLWQYQLKDDGYGVLNLIKVRNIGGFSGKKEIEALAIDDELGYLYYSDEGVGIRKYHADPDSSTEELEIFGQMGFAEDQEGISILPTGRSTGYIIVSDQQANAFRVFSREKKGHPFVVSIPFSTNESDGSDLTIVPLNATFPAGLFVAMSDDRTFQYYRLEDILSSIKKSLIVFQ